MLVFPHMMTDCIRLSHIFRYKIVFLSLAGTLFLKALQVRRENHMHATPGHPPIQLLCYSHPQTIEETFMFSIVLKLAAGSCTIPPGTNTININHRTLACRMYAWN